jgi:adenylosuccinate lyase
MQAQSEGLHFKQALINNRQISAILTNDEIAALFDLEQSTGVCADMVDQVIAQIHLP